MSLRLPSKLFIASGIVFIFSFHWACGVENPREHENNGLKKLVLQAIENYYFIELDNKELEKRSLSECMQFLDKDSSLVQTLTKDSNFVRGFKKRKSIGEVKTFVPHVGYLQFNYFSRSSPLEFKRAFKQFKKEGVCKLILDLRGNEGGDFDAALQISEYFVPKNKAMVILQKKNESSVHISNNDNPLHIPVVILVDAQTASSSELLALILRKFGGAKIVGEKTKGKRSIQKVIPIDSYWLTLTIGSWHLEEEANAPTQPFVCPNYELSGWDQQIEMALSLFNPTFALENENRDEKDGSDFGTKK